MMTDKTRSSLHTLITKRYILAVTIIALLSSFAAYTLKSALSDVDNTAYIVNISGSQRMLSQHIALDIHRLYQQRFVMNTDQTETENLLTQHIDKMKSANHQLASGQLNNGHQLELSPAIRDIYFSDVDLYDRVNFYLKIATQILDTTSEEPFLQLMNEIDSSSENLLIDLDKAVNQYQREGDERLAIIKRLEVGVWLVTLLTLLLHVMQNNGCLTALKIKLNFVPINLKPPTKNYKSWLVKILSLI
jgi:two-component system, cell cycle response regulator